MPLTTTERVFCIAAEKAEKDRLAAELADQRAAAESAAVTEAGDRAAAAEEQVVTEKALRATSQRKLRMLQEVGAPKHRCSTRLVPSPRSAQCWQLPPTH